jgi:hypothetical protein
MSTVEFFTRKGYNSSGSSEGTAATFHAAMATTTAALAEQQRRHCEQQCCNFQRLSTALPTATALVVKVKARTSNVYVQNVTR